MVRKQFENKGLAGCHLEDQIAEKRCGHLDNKELVTKEEMVKKIQESVKARKDNNFLIAPADGMICQIENDVSGPKELSLENEKFNKISIFMNVFDCHVNRFPIECTVDEVFYKPGEYLNASLNDASLKNERNLIKITSAQNDKIVVTQVAGLVARRIISYCNQGDKYEQGQSFGIIRFGSRVDLLFSNKFKILVKKGQTVTGGESILSQRIN